MPLPGTITDPESPRPAVYPDETPETSVEQRICLACGFCCDGTLFDSAIVEPGERDRLPVKIAARTGISGQQEYFTLPCPYFQGKCTIYEKHKAEICSGFRCRLLKDVAANELTSAEAMQIIHMAGTCRNEIIKAFQEVWQVTEELSFRLILDRLNGAELNDQTEPRRRALRLLIARGNILDTLLTRYFKPKQEFNRMKASVPVCSDFNG